MEFSEVIEVLDRGSSIDVQSDCTFQSLLIGGKTLERLKSSQFVRPSPVQAKAIPIGLLGRDMLVQAKSGTGKTLVFSVLAVENLNLQSAFIQKVIITPTREISVQIKETVRKVAPAGARTSVYVGGSAHKLNQIDLRQTRPQIVIGTPGRIAQLLKLGSLDMSHVDFFVLDEADKLMDDVFRDDINSVINALPPIRQVAVFSATYPRNLDALLSTFLRDAALVRFNADDVQLVNIKQYVVTKCSPMLEKLTKVLKSIRYVQALVFCDQIAKCEPIASHLKSEGLDVTFVSSAMSQKERQLAVDQLRTKRVKILVSSDLTARGIDADHVNLVVNVDAAANEETYFHRIGRAARFGAHGAAVTLLEDEKAQKCFTALAYRGKVTVKRVGTVDSLPDDLVKNQEFWDSLPYFIDFEKPRKSAEPNDLSKVPDREAAVQDLQKTRGSTDTWKYDREEMMKMRNAQPQDEKKNESPIANPVDLVEKTEELSLEEKENEEEEDKPVVKKSFKERLAELKAAKQQEKKEQKEEPKVETKTKFKFVPTREKAKKKYYMRGELQHIRDSFTSEQWRAYAETKFDFSQEPFLDAFPAPKKAGSAESISKERGQGDFKNPSKSQSKPEQRPPKRSKKKLNIIQYNRFDLKKIQLEIPVEQWIPYVKAKWDTTEEPWEMDPVMRCPFEERLRRIRNKEKAERKKVIAERKKKRDEDRSELVSSGKNTQTTVIQDKSWEDYAARLKKDFEERTAKRKQEEAEGKEKPLRRIGPVVPERTPPLIYRYRVDMYKRRLAEQDAFLMHQTKMEDGKIREIEIQTDHAVIKEEKELVEMECQTDEVELEQPEEYVEDEEYWDEEEEYWDEDEEEFWDEEVEEEVEEQQVGTPQGHVEFQTATQNYINLMNNFSRNAH